MRIQRQRTIQPANDSANRSGFFMPFFAIMLVMLLGFVGLVIDIGRLHRAQREAQNAADAAVLAAAMARLRGLNDEDVLAEANSIRAQNCPDSLPLTLNGGTRDAMNIPPVAGPHVSLPNNTDYVEVYVTVPVQTLFVHILGIEQNREVAARAVAGNEPPAGGEGVIVLDPQAIPGISVSGSVNSNGTTDATIVRVDGGLLVNSLGDGWNQWGQWVDTYPPDAPSTGSTDPGVSTQTTNDTPTPSIEVKFAALAGGTSSTNSTHYKTFGDLNYPNGKTPLFAGTGLLFPDPLRNFPVPQPSVDPRVNPNVINYDQIVVQSGQIGVLVDTGRKDPVAGTYDGVTVSPAGTVVPGVYDFSNGSVATLPPGLYHDIKIHNGTQVTFSPGVYIISPQLGQKNQGIAITGSATVQGDGVMFYFTGDNYISAGYEPGYWDALDDSSNNQLDGPLPMTWSAPDENTVWNSIKNGRSVPPGDDPFPGSVAYAQLTINLNAGVLNLRGLAETGGKFDNMLVFARRRNNNTLSVAGNAADADIDLKGVVYAKWAPLDISGGGQWKAQFVIGSLKASGGGIVTIEGFGFSWQGTAKKVYLVE